MSTMMLALLTQFGHLIHSRAEYAINLSKGFTAMWLSSAQVLFS